ALLPGCGRLALWRRWDAVTLENVAHGLVTHDVSQVGEGADDPVIAPRAIVLGHTNNQGLQLLADFGTARRLPLLGAVKFLSDQCAVPGQDRVRLDDLGHLRQRFLAQLLAHLGQRLALAIAQADATFDLVAQYAIFRHEILVAYQQFLIDGPCDRRQQVFAVHRLLPQALPSLWTLSMGKSGAEDKPTRGRW